MSYDPPVRKLEDEASANADPGVPLLFVRQDTPANTSGTDGDYEAPKMSAGRIWVSAVVTQLPALPTGANVIGALVANQSVNVAQINGVATSVGAGAVGTGVQRVVLANNEALPPGTNVIGALSANQSVNVAQMNGVATSMGAGVVGTGVQRVVLANNEALPPGTNVIGALSANQSVNVAQINGVATSVGAGVVGTGVQRVVLANNEALPAGSNIIGNVRVDQTTPGTTNGVVHPNTTTGPTQITALDAVVGAPAGNGALISGTPTAGSYVAAQAVGGEGTFTIIKGSGTYTGTVYVEVSANSTNGADGVWAVATIQRMGAVDPTLAFGTSSTSAEQWRGNMAGAKWVRARLVGSAFTSGPNVTIVLSAAPPALDPQSERAATFRGRIQTFRTPGRAGTAGQKIFAIHNATGSARVVRVRNLWVDKYETVVKAVTTAPPVIRVHRFTALPTNGSALTAVAEDSTLSSSASVTLWGDASADGTGSGTTLTVTIPASSCIAQEFAPRLITAAGYEMTDKVTLLENEDIVLRALEGLVVFLDYSAAGQNPTTDMWLVGCDWYER